MNPTIQRQKTSDACFGEMVDEKGKFICCTMERLFNGAPVIPAGTWKFVRYDSPHFGFPVFKCDDIPGHTKIEIHPANFPEQLEGCVAVGEQIAARPSTGGHMLMKSDAAFENWMKIQVGVDECEITFED